MNALEEFVQRFAELERKVSGMIRAGAVTDVDPKKHRVRLEVGRDGSGNVVKGPWIPYTQIAGALSVHTPPSVGQQMMAVSPSGDPSQAAALPFTWSGSNRSPSQAGNEHVVRFGGMTITLKEGELAVRGGKISHDGRNIGRDHHHSGVEPGGGQTGDPT